MGRKIKLPFVFGKPERTAILLGNDRSGSSWVADCLFRSPEVDFYYEPSNPGSGVGGSWDLWNVVPDLNEEHSMIDPVYQPVVENRWIQTGELVSPRVVWSKLFGNQFVAVKDVGLVLAGEYLAKRFDARICLLFRHPVAVALSSRGLGDENAEKWYQMVSRQKMLKQSYRDELKCHYERATSFLEKFVAVVSTKYRIMSDQLSRHPEWVKTRYEDFCKSPEDETRRVCAELETPVADDLKGYLEETTSGDDGYRFGRVRNTSSMHMKWTSRISEEVKIQLWEFWKESGNSEYQDPVLDWGLSE